MDATLEAVTRESRGKNEARRLRVAGRIPAVVYGGQNQDALAISVDPKALSRLLHSESGANTLIDLKVDGGAPTAVLVKAFLLEPVHHHLLHADFYRVSLDQAITVTVQVVLKGEPKGVKLQGGIVDFPNREVELECLPAEIPENIEVDISELMIGQGVRLRDLATGVKWTTISDPDTLIVHVVPPRAEEPTAAEATAAATPAEPELIKKGKPEKEEE